MYQTARSSIVKGRWILGCSPISSVLCDSCICSVWPLVVASSAGLSGCAAIRIRGSIWGSYAELKLLRHRLAPVTIEQLDYADVIRRYDGAGTLFFLDPPYDETTDYGIEFGREQYLAMADQLGGSRGRFILSINDTPFIRETFARFAIAEVETTWTLSSASTGRGKKVTELIIRNRQ